MNKQKIYRVYIHTTPDGMVYVGVTKNIKYRWRPSAYKRTALEPYINEFGWRNIKHEVIYTCEDRTEAFEVEGDMIDYYDDKGVLINKVRSGLLCTTNRQEYDKQYRDEHKNEISEWHKQYYKYHKEERTAYKRQYRLKMKQSQSDNLGIAS